MIQIEYKGDLYRRYGSKWVDYRNFVVHSALQDELNHVYVNNVDLESLTLPELIYEGDKYKESSSYSIAIRFYREALVYADADEVRYILPRITSCYRKTNYPDLAIHLFSLVKKKYSAQIMNSALLTSAAAAYCDMREYKNALICARKAYAKAGGKADENLKGVFERIKHESGLI